MQNYTHIVQDGLIIESTPLYNVYEVQGKYFRVSHPNYIFADHEINRLSKIENNIESIQSILDLEFFKSKQFVQNDTWIETVDNIRNDLLKQYKELESCSKIINPIAYKTYSWNILESFKKLEKTINEKNIKYNITNIYLKEIPTIEELVDYIVEPKKEQKKTKKEKHVKKVKKVSTTELSNGNIKTIKSLSRTRFKCGDFNECISKQSSKPYFMSKSDICTIIKDDDKLKKKFPKNFEKLTKEQVCEILFEKK